MSIRLALEADIPRILEIYRPYVEQTTVTFEYETPTAEAFLERFREITERFPFLVWEEEGRVLGYAYATLPFSREAYRWLAEPSIYLDRQARGRGIGRKLYTALEDILRLLGYRLSYALITSENEASLRFHEALGYRVLAHFPGCAYKMGRQLGVTWMEKILISAEMPSNFPKPFPSFVENIENFTKILDILSLS
jgi:phosphinothricin acetyltransferase